MTEPSAPGEEPAFEAVLYPNQPPPARSLIVLLALILGVAFAVGTGFYLVGAWPVLGFMGAEIALLAICLIHGRRVAAYAEHIRLDREGLHVKAVARGRVLKSWSFEPYWVRVRLDEIRPGEPMLRLTAHGRTLTLGRFLNSQERTDVATALREALARYRELPAVGHA